MVISDPDDTCPGLWVDVDADLGYCDLGDECRTPVREAHHRRVAEWLDTVSDEPMVAQRGTNYDEATRRVVLVGLPVRLWDRARQHSAALVREFAFIVVEGRRDTTL